MAKLTDTQLMVLSKAAARDDGIASIPGGLNKAAAAKVAASLVSRKLMREVRSKPDMPVWRENEEGRGKSLVITREGREAIGLENCENDSSNLSSGAEETDAQRRHRCRCRKSDPDIPMVQSAEDRQRQNATYRLDRPRKAGKRSC
jgi:hypothetical protein